jgi:short-subunit dehydrogenase
MKMNKTVLLVGAAGGVGLELVKLLLANSYDVIGTVLNDTEAEQVKAVAPDVRCLINMDLSDADAIQSTLKPVLDMPEVNLVAAVVCAGFSYIGPLELQPLNTLRKTLEINTVANVAVYQACMPYLRKTKGHLLLIASNAGRSGIPFLGHYVASKFALEGLGDVMRREAANFGVKVSLIEPGAIKTGMSFGQLEAIDKDMASLTAQETELYGESYQAFKGLLGSIHAGMEPIEVAQAMLGALQSENPETRYQVGQDAIDTIEMAFNLSDRDIDTFYKNVLEQASAINAGESKTNVLTNS